jgi:hypothetical protein
MCHPRAAVRGLAFGGLSLSLCFQAPFGDVRCAPSGFTASSVSQPSRSLNHDTHASLRTLLLDTCSQRNFSQNLLGDDIYQVQRTIYDVLVRQIAGTAAIDPDELLFAVRSSCAAFKSGKPSYLPDR